MLESRDHDHHGGLQPHNLLDRGQKVRVARHQQHAIRPVRRQTPLDQMGRQRDVNAFLDGLEDALRAARARQPSASPVMVAAEIDGHGDHFDVTKARERRQGGFLAPEQSLVVGMNIDDPGLEADDPLAYNYKFVRFQGRFPPVCAVAVNYSFSQPLSKRANSSLDDPPDVRQLTPCPPTTLCDVRVVDERFHHEDTVGRDTPRCSSRT
jgi:hypothetical protein